jgi:glycosyltransferase involved in cell wall biosynthesis
MQHKNSHLPLVSIGLPVYNGQNYLSQAIESVLNQTYQNWELIISDNGSTDNTANICNFYAEKDSRIRVYRYEENQGASRNFNRTFEESTGKYFKWLAHDDLLVPENIEKCVGVLEANPDCVLCGSPKKNVRFNGEYIDVGEYKGLHLTDDNTVSRYQALLKYFYRSFKDADFILTGLMRHDIFKETILLANYTSADFTLLADLILKGKFIILSEPLYIRRYHHGFSMSVYNNNPNAINVDPSAKIKYKSHAEVAKWYDPKGKVRRFPHMTWLNELLNSIEKNKFPESEKAQLRKVSYQWFFRRTITSVKENVKKVISLA